MRRVASLRRLAVLVTLPLTVVLVAQYFAGASTDRGDDLERDLDVLESKILHHEELIAACMASKGWEYVPSLPASFVYERANVLAEADGETVDVEAVQVPDNPNHDIVARLTEAEKDSRATAYWGDPANGTSEGCYYSTYEEAWGSFPVPDNDDVETMLTALRSDPRIVEARGAYSACMAGKGYLVADPMSDIFEMYLGREEALIDAIEADGGDHLQSGLLASYRAERAVAFAAHDECVEAYREVESVVKVEILRLERTRETQ